VPGIASFTMVPCALLFIDGEMSCMKHFVVPRLILQIISLEYPENRRAILSYVTISLDMSSASLARNIL